MASQLSKASNSCMASCMGRRGDGRDRNQEDAPRQQDVLKTCGICGTEVRINPQAQVFICQQCRAVNRIGDFGASALPPGPEALRRTASGIFQPTTDAQAAAAVVEPPVTEIKSCTVCLDGVGDCVFMPCAHGGFCEACARHIAGNAAVGGAHCPRCRRAIERVLRITQATGGSIVKAVDLKVQLGEASGRKAPPRVPPPPGSRKKQLNMQSEEEQK